MLRLKTLFSSATLFFTLNGCANLPQNLHNDAQLENATDREKAIACKNYERAIDKAEIDALGITYRLFHDPVKNGVPGSQASFSRFITQPRAGENITKDRKNYHELRDTAQDIRTKACNAGCKDHLMVLLCPQ